MATTPARVTVIGNSQPHLTIKAEVLVHFWQVETVALDQGQIPSLDTEVVVVCDTLPEVDRQHWVEKIRAEAPHLLVVKMNAHDSGPHAKADAIVDETHGPAALVSTIYGLFHERGLPNRPWPEQAHILLQ